MSAKQDKTATAPEPEILGHYIGGQMVLPAGHTIDIVNPATGSVIKQVGVADTSVIDKAVAAAVKALPVWQQTSPVNRARIMFRFRELLAQHADNIIKIITLEHGKTLDDARGEFMRGVEIVEYACAAPELLKGQHSKQVATDIDSWSEFAPLGVVAGITPFNFPVMVPMWMYPMALVCGNAFILKPSEKDPGVSFYIAGLLKEAGLPDGIFNVVNGDRHTVDALLEHKKVAAVSFVGSTAVAEHIYHTGTGNGKRVQALGGAKNHAVVMPDADINNVVKSLIGAAFGSCGERCMAISVAVCVGDAIADSVITGLAEQIRGFKIGNGLDPDNDLGPLISREHLNKVTAYIESGIKEGAKLVVDGRGLKVPGGEKGFFLGGCLFDQVKPGMQIYTDEIFGPVLCVVRVQTLQQAIQLINDHEYGNGACIFTRDGGTARLFSDNIEIGMVGINVPLPVPAAWHSFGGWKRSLFGDLSIYGPDAIRFYTRRKTVTQRWPSAPADKAQFSFPSNQ
jgi:malonate-semialdehyde dehydrogenase (acetylating)/methylmalonate-semialdehyde dehydrogenase